MSRSRSALVVPAWMLGAIVGAAGLAAGLGAGTDAAERWQLAARYTARLAFPGFLAAFVAGPWQRLRPGPLPRTLVRHRRAIGVGFAAVFAAHLLALVLFHVERGVMPGAATLVVGGGALVATALLAATSNDAAVRLLGPARWRRLHAVGSWWIWLVFAITYGGRMASSPGPTAVFGIACLGAFALRVGAWRRVAGAATA